MLIASSVKEKGDNFRPTTGYGLLRLLRLKIPGCTGFSKYWLSDLSDFNELFTYKTSQKDVPHLNNIN